MSVTVIAIDPGETTGVAVWRSGDTVAPTTGELTPSFFYDFALEIAQAEPGAVIVCEAFVITQATLRKTFQPWSLEMIGVVKWMCHQGGHTLWTPMPKASDVKSMVTNDVLRRLGWWHVGGDGHANDALRHLARYGFITELLDRRLLLDT